MNFHSSCLASDKGVSKLQWKFQGSFQSQRLTIREFSTQSGAQSLEQTLLPIISMFVSHVERMELTRYEIQKQNYNIEN